MNNMLLKYEDLKYFLDANKSILSIINRAKKYRQMKLNTKPLTTEQRIAIIADYNAEKIEAIKALIEEAKVDFINNLVIVPENDWAGQYAEYFTIQPKIK